jgi:NADH dehydrogenase (ubiquinone) 1 alpha subcomplex subunit 9
MAEISELVDREILKTRRHINVPRWLMGPGLELMNKLLYWPVGCKDMVTREFTDQFIDKNAKTFKDLGMEAGDIANFTYKYLVSLLFHMVLFVLVVWDCC